MTCNMPAGSTLYTGSAAVTTVTRHGTTHWDQASELTRTQRQLTFNITFQLYLYRKCNPICCRYCLIQLLDSVPADRMTANELEVLEHYNRKILKYGENPEVLLKCLGKLDQVRVNIELLSVG